MAFCASCGSQVDGKFCAKCGAAVAAEAGAATAVPPAAAQAQASGLSDNMAAALCYLLGLLTGVLFLVLAPYNTNRTIRFHAFQAIFAHVALIVIWIGFGIVFSVMATVPVLGPMIALAAWPILGLGCFALWLLLMYKAYNNEKWVLPLIGPLAEKQANA
jgi:uncharacterized membrane protein